MKARALKLRGSGLGTEGRSLVGTYILIKVFGELGVECRKGMAGCGLGKLILVAWDLYKPAYWCGARSARRRWRVPEGAQFWSGVVSHSSIAFWAEKRARILEIFRLGGENGRVGYI